MRKDEALFTANAIGIEMFHKRGVTINRPMGSGDFVFIHFLTPVEILIDGESRIEPPNACIVYAPSYRQYYCNVENTSFGNNWMHFSGKAGEELFESLNIPVNRSFHPADTTFVATELRNINDEKIRNEPFWRTGVDLAIRRLFLKLARSVVPVAKASVTVKHLYTLEQMQKLRARMRENCFEPWTVERMAGIVHLSKSRFSVLYKKVFRVSPLADLLHMRMELAKYYLGMMHMSVEDVAESCGFASVYYFHRQFKKLNGITPGMFQSTYSGEDLHSPYHRRVDDLARRGKLGKPKA